MYLNTYTDCVRPDGFQVPSEGLCALLGVIVLMMMGEEAVSPGDSYSGHTAISGSMDTSS